MTIRALKQTDGKYRVRIYDGKDENGKYIRKSFTASTKRDAEKMAKDYIEAKEQQKELEAAGPTIAEAYTEYIESRKNCVSPATIKGYNGTYNGCFGEIENVPVSLLTQRIVQEWANHISVDRAPKTVKNAHGLLSAILQLQGSPLQLRTRLPAGRKKDIYVPDADEVREIGLMLQGHPLYIPFILATQCGLRASEISGLRVDCITRAGIVIKQARVDGVNGAEIKQPKSYAGYRTIPASEKMKDILRAAADEDGYITKMRSVNISNNWLKWRDSHGLSVSLNFHALRHHFASKCLLQGMEQRYIAELMGHTDTRMIERVYQHVFAAKLAERGRRMVEESDAFFADMEAHKKGA